MHTRSVFVAVAFGILAGWTATATAAPTPEQKCQAGKNQEAGKYAFCLQKAEKKLVLTGDMTRYNEAVAKCETKFAEKWQKLIDKAAEDAATCPDAPLTQAQFKSVIDEHSDNIATALGGGRLSTCGGFPASGHTTAYGTGSDGDVQAGSTLSYTDNGDGTITDNVTGLMWEKKDDSGGIHDKDNT